VLGWDRGADVVSELIPRIYLDFVRGGHADPLVPVFHHNQLDLRGLAGLSGRILSLLGDKEATSQDGLELYGVSRICERRGEVKRARKLYEQSIALVLPTEADRAARTALARLAKRDGDLALACELWESTVFVVRTSETGLALGPSYGLSFSSTLGSWFQRPRL